MKKLLKQTFLYYIFTTLAIFAGEMLAVLPSLLFRSFFQKNMLDAHLISGLLSELCIAGILFFLVQRDCYETRQFTFKTVILPILTVSIIRYLLWVATSGSIAFWVSGGATEFSYLFFPGISSAFLSPETTLHHLIIIILCDVVFILPAFIGGGYFGYKRRIRENEKMIAEHEAKTQ